MNYVLFGSHINAWSIWKGLRLLGLQGQCIAPEAQLLTPTGAPPIAC